MKRALIAAALVLTIVNSAWAWDGWNVSICGIDPFDLKGRHPAKIIAGAVLSLAVHEAGHMAVGALEGQNPRLHGTSVLVDGPASQEFLAAGFAAQAIVGSVLTIVNRRSDYTYGFNAFTAANSAVYGITGGIGEYSDVEQLDNGRAWAFGTAAVGTALTIVNRR